MIRICFAGSHLIFSHTDSVLACDTSTGSVRTLDAVPTNAVAYAGSREYAGNGRSFVAFATEGEEGMWLQCVDVVTGGATTPRGWPISGTSALAIDVSAACCALATEETVAVLDQHVNELFMFAVPITVVALTCWRTTVGCFVGDRAGNVYSVTPAGVAFVGSTPDGLTELYALADLSCLANTRDCVAVLFSKTGKCVQFDRCK